MTLFTLLASLSAFNRLFIYGLRSISFLPFFPIRFEPVCTVLAIIGLVVEISFVHLSFAISFRLLELMLVIRPGWHLHFLFVHGV